VHDVLDLREMLSDEIVAQRESGHLVEDLDRETLRSADEDRLRALIARVQSAPRRDDWDYEEPDDLDEIIAARPPAPERASWTPDRNVMRDRLYGAWLGRCAGCTLGKPVENWPRLAIRRYLTQQVAYPLRDYIPADARPGNDHPPFHPSWSESVRGRIDGSPRDDDTDYTILATHILETYGPDFTPEDVGHEWLRRFPFMAVYTAERAAYRNLILGLAPPATATHINPYREWIGAQIRVDAYGYACAGDPERAAGMAYADARLSHTGNGIYGALWAAALIAASFAESAMAAALASALAVVPARSRLAEALRGVLELHSQGRDWESARDVLEERHGQLSPVHTINNAAVVSAALLWGDGDFTRTIGLAVQAGWDTDCNGATAGSAFGAMHGRAALGAHWITPLHDRLSTALVGFQEQRISELAERALALTLATSCDA
jgi:ADP-ribosylglycohydrolase